MAKLETHYPLSDVDASAIIGMNQFNDVLVVTTKRRISVIDISSRRVTRSFPLDDDLFTSPAVVTNTVGVGKSSRLQIQ